MVFHVRLTAIAPLSFPMPFLSHLAGTIFSPLVPSASWRPLCSSSRLGCDPSQPFHSRRLRVRGLTSTPLRRREISRLQRRSTLQGLFLCPALCIPILAHKIDAYSLHVCFFMPGASSPSFLPGMDGALIDSSSRLSSPRQFGNFSLMTSAPLFVAFFHGILPLCLWRSL